MSFATVGLVMIVKDEAHVIERCLRSVLPVIDHAVIVDTGSTDRTREVVREFLADNGISGGTIDRPWRDFAHNRSEALAALREVPGVDYALTLDADEELRIEPGLDIGAFKARLTADVYDVEVVLDESTVYTRPTLFSNRLPFAYRGVIHEFLQLPAGASRDTAAGMRVVSKHEGARSREADRYAKDAEILEATLLVETDPFLISRYSFYLAQSYRDSGQHQKAHDAYLKRAELGFWVEEVYVSLLRAAQLLELLEAPFDEQLALYLRAVEASPGRAESFHGAAAACRKAGRYQVGYVLARHGLTLPQPAGGLFLDKTVYDYRMLDEFQVNAYWAGHYRDSLDAAATILNDKKYPAEEEPRFLANMRYALTKLEEAGEIDVAAVLAAAGGTGSS